MSFNLYSVLARFRFHKECLNIPNYVFSRYGGVKYWECDECWREGVFRLGGKIELNDGKEVSLVQSCPFDSVLTILFVFEKENPKLLPNSSLHSAIYTLKDCLRLARMGQYDAGKYEFMKYVMSVDKEMAKHFTRNGENICDTYGDLHDVVLQHLSSTWLIEFTSSCSNRMCSLKDQRHCRSHFTLLPAEHKT